MGPPSSAPLANHLLHVATGSVKQQDAPWPRRGWTLMAAMVTALALAAAPAPTRALDWSNMAKDEFIVQARAGTVEDSRQLLNLNLAAEDFPNAGPNGTPYHLSTDVGGITYCQQEVGIPIPIPLPIQRVSCVTVSYRIVSYALGPACAPASPGTFVCSFARPRSIHPCE